MYMYVDNLTHNALRSRQLVTEAIQLAVYMYV